MSRRYIKTFESFIAPPSTLRSKVVLKRTKQEDLYNDQFTNNKPTVKVEKRKKKDDPKEEMKEEEDDQNEEEESA